MIRAWFRKTFPLPPPPHSPPQANSCGVESVPRGARVWQREWGCVGQEMHPQQGPSAGKWGAARWHTPPESQLQLSSDPQRGWFSCSIVSDSVWPTRLLCPCDSPGKNTGVGSFSLRQGIFPTQGSNPGLLHRRPILYQLSHEGSLREGRDRSSEHGHQEARGPQRRPDGARSVPREAEAGRGLGAAGTVLGPLCHHAQLWASPHHEAPRNPV